MGFEPMTSAIPVRCSTDCAMKPRLKQVRCEFNLYLSYEENDVIFVIHTLSYTLHINFNLL